MQMLNSYVVKYHNLTKDRHEYKCLDIEVGGMRAQEVFDEINNQIWDSLAHGDGNDMFEIISITLLKSEVSLLAPKATTEEAVQAARNKTERQAQMVEALKIACGGHFFEQE